MLYSSGDTPLVVTATDAAAGAPVDAYAADADTDGNYEALNIVFASAPPSGTNNVTVSWTVELDH